LINFRTYIAARGWLPTVRTSGLLVPAVFTILVACGSIAKVTEKKEAGAFHLSSYFPIWPGLWFTSSARGWPCRFYYISDLPKEIRASDEGLSPVGLLCDVAVVLVLVVATWRCFGKFRLQFGLMDLLVLTGCFALAMSFHLSAWDREFAPAQLAIDIGVFAVAIQLVSWARRVGKMVRKMVRGEAAES
jgi:uncharacterized protein YceK